MLKRFLLALALCLLAVPGYSLRQNAAKPAGAAQALPADAPSRDQVMTLMDLLQVRKSMTAMMESMKQVMKQTAEESFRKKVANPSPEQLKAVHASIDVILDGLPMDEMVNAVVTVYQRHLTRTDLEELIRFYSSPVGQKLIHEQPQIIQESMQAGAEVERKRMDEIMIKIDQSLQKLDEAEKTQPAPAKK